MIINVLYDFKELGFLIYKNRMERNMTQTELGKELNLSKGFISRMEHGEFSRLSIPNLYKIAKKFGFEIKLCIISEQK